MPTSEVLDAAADTHGERRAARRTRHFFARGRIAAARGMQAQPFRCAGVSNRAPRLNPSKIRVRPAAQRPRLQL